MKNKALNKLALLDTIFLITCLGVMGTVLFSQVITRYVFRTPLVWSEEAARYLHVWIALFGIHYGFRHNAHIRVTFFYDRLPAQLKHAVSFISNLIILITLGIYLPGSIIFIKDQATIVSSAMSINMGLVYFPSFFGPLIAFLYFIMQALNSLKLMLSGAPANTESATTPTDTSDNTILSKGDR